MLKNLIIACLVAALAASVAVTAIASNDLWHTHPDGGGPVWSSPPETTTPTPSPEPDPVVRITRTVVNGCSLATSRLVSMTAWVLFALDDPGPLFRHLGPSIELDLSIADQDGNVIVSKRALATPGTLLRWEQYGGWYVSFSPYYNEATDAVRARFRAGPDVTSITCRADARVIPAPTGSERTVD